MGVGILGTELGCQYGLSKILSTLPQLKRSPSELETSYAKQQAEVEKKAQMLLKESPARAAAYLTDYLQTALSA